MLAYDWNFLGLSTETKPLSGEKVVDGSTFYECDTSSFFIFYHGEWYQQTFVTEDGINFWLYKALMKKMFGKWFDGNISLGKIIKPTTGTEIEFTNSLPAQITDLTGYGDTFQQTYSGKNLLPASGLTPETYTGGLTITPVYNTNDELMYILVNGTYTGETYFYYHIGDMSFEEGKTYTLSGSIGGSNSTYCIWVSAGTAFPLGNRLSSTNGAGTATASASQANGSVDIQIYPNATLDNVKFYPQIELSSTATPYEPYVGGTASPNPDYPQPIQTVTGEQTVTINGEQVYTIDLGTIELCKIGGYQDYIYRDEDGDWYVHRASKKVVCNGGESWSVNTDVVRQHILTLSDNANSDNATRAASKSDNFIYGTDYPNKFYITGNGSQIVIRQPESNGSLIAFSTADWKTWLSTHNVAFYYVLATPTDTKITDNTLISNLNSLLNYMFPAGDHQIVITADGLPMALKLTITEKE